MDLLIICDSSAIHQGFIGVCCHWLVMKAKDEWRRGWDTARKTAPERIEESLAENRDVLTVGAAPDERS